MPQAAPSTTGTVALCGVVRSSRKFADSYGESRTATLLSCATANGGRGMYEVFSGEPLATVGQEVNILCAVSGVPHAYNVGEGDSRRRIQTARHYLNLVVA